MIINTSQAARSAARNFKSYDSDDSDSEDSEEMPSEDSDSDDSNAGGKRKSKAARARAVRVPAAVKVFKPWTLTLNPKTLRWGSHCVWTIACVPLEYVWMKIELVPGVPR